MSAVTKSLTAAAPSWVATAVRLAQEQRIFHPAAPTVNTTATSAFTTTPSAAFVMNASEITRVVKSLQHAFPSNTIHAFACKSNPLTAVLKHLSGLGMACETASIGEFLTAEKHFGASKVVFDSPVKTVDELRYVLRTPCFLNVDNFDELERVAAILAEYQAKGETTALPVVGIRVNPQIGAGSIDALSTGRSTSKFGIGLEDHRADLIAAYKKYPWLKMVHVHTGSQGLPVDLMVRSIEKIYGFTQELGPQVTHLDIGGGLSVNFGSDDYTPSFETYVAALKHALPGLFAAEAHLTLITEFGRSVVAKAGIYLSRVEYTKVTGGRTIIAQHCGHDLLLRTVWGPADWPLRVHVFGPDSTERREEPSVTDVAGPCCLGGDLACKERWLPRAFPDDLIVIRDVGGYYHVSYNYYNLRQAPPVYWFDDEKNTFKCIQRSKSVEETLAFFQCDE